MTIRVGCFAPDSSLVGSIAPSPNHGERPGGAAIDSLILHYTGMADGGSALAWLRDPASRVSSHYLVDEAGAVAQLVPESRRAWHAGLGVWFDNRDLNSCSVGIEIANGGHDFGLPPFPPRQIAAVVALCRDVIARHAIRPERVLAHADVAPKRKQDPGEAFPWGELFANGVGHWVKPRAGSPTLAVLPGSEPGAVRALQDALARYGYGIAATGVYDEDTRAVVTAFQRHFRPARVDGLADGGTVATLRALLRGLSGTGPSRRSRARQQPVEVALDPVLRGFGRA